VCVCVREREESAHDGVTTAGNDVTSSWRDRERSACPRMYFTFSFLSMSFSNVSKITSSVSGTCIERERERKGEREREREREKGREGEKG
jgi:hypothetical protein